MRVRLVQITVRPNGKQARREDRIETNALRIGRAPGNEIELDGLAVAMHHATIESHIDGAYVLPVADNEVLVNGTHIADESRLAPGDSIRIASHELRVLEPSHTEDIALEVQQVAGHTSELDDLRSRTQLTLERGAWSRRPLSWGAVGVVLLLGLVIPLATGLRGSWTSGELTRKHSFIANDCSQCHSPFQRTPDDSCLACHTGITSHAAADRTLPALEDATCASCHLEHNGPGGLAALEEGLCAECHADLSSKLSTVASSAGTKLPDASDFRSQHPEFQLHMREPTPGDARHTAVREWSPTVREKSGVKFDHALHNGVVLESEGVMCSYCHTLGPAGRTMQPVVFEEQCADCHALNEYDSNVRRELSHVTPSEVRRELTASFLKQAFAGKAKIGERQMFGYMAQRGYSPTNPERREIDRWVERSVADAERRLYVEDAADDDEVAADGNDRALGPCVMCHSVARAGTAGRAPELAPIGLTERWVPASQFAHDTHLPFQCATCHPAAAALEHNERTPRLAQPGMVPYGTLSAAELRERNLAPSTSASDVLVLGVESCRGCHASAVAQPPAIASPCVMCHPFHRDDQEGIGERRRDAAAARKASNETGSEAG